MVWKRASGRVTQVAGGGISLIQRRDFRLPRAGLLQCRARAGAATAASELIGPMAYDDHVLKESFDADRNHSAS